MPPARPPAPDSPGEFARARLTGTPAPCFLAGGGRIILPAFSSNAAGSDVVTARVPVEWLAAPLRCLVSTGVELLDFGPLLDLRRRHRIGAL